MLVNVDPTARVAPRARLGKNVTIGPYSIVHENVVLDDDVEVGAHCVLGHASRLQGAEPLHIGQGSLIRSHSIFYEGTRIGPQLQTGHHVTVREGLVAGRGLQLGTFCDIQGDSRFGDYVRFHSNVHVGQKSTLGNFVWIFPNVVLTNDPHPPSNVLLGVTVEDYAAIATMSCVLPGVRIGTRSLVGAHSLVTSDVPADMVASGVPATVRGRARSIRLRDGSGRPAYPWMTHFHRGYPPEVVEGWKETFGAGHSPVK